METINNVEEITVEFNIQHGKYYIKDEYDKLNSFVRKNFETLLEGARRLSLSKRGIFS